MTSPVSALHRCERRYLKQLTIFEGRLMRDDSRHGHVERLRDVHQRFAVLENGSDELVHEMTVRAAMRAGGYTGRKRRTPSVGERLFQPFVLPVEGAFLTANAPHFSANSRRI